MLFTKEDLAEYATLCHRTDLNTHNKGGGRVQEGEPVLGVWQHGHEEVLPGEGPQQGDQGQHACAQQANVGAEHHTVPLQHDTCNHKGSSGMLVALCWSFYGCVPCVSL